MAYIKGRLTTINRAVNFPPSMPSFGLGKSHRKSGKVEDEVWADPTLAASPPRKCKQRGDPGDYSFGTQYIRWQNGKHGIRFVYYVQRCGKNKWWGPVQKAPASTVRIMKRLIEGTLRKKKWFAEA